MRCIILHAVIAMENFPRKMRREAVPIDQQINNLLQQQINRNREILKSLFKTIIFCGKNNIALRGTRDDDPRNPSLSGNFQALLEFRIDSGDQTLKHHLETAPRNATYVSKTIQNEMITTVGAIIVNNLSQEIRDSKYLPAELLLWERIWKGKNDRREDIPDSIDATLEQIDKDAYVNIYTILQILITIPISSASCERSISTLRNLKTYLRSTMVQDRLNGLALMHAHREM